MSKKIISLILTIVMFATILVGCASSNSTSTTGSTSQVESDDVSESETEDKTYKVAMILDSSISDGGWGAACYNAMITAAEKCGFETQYTDNLTTADFAPTMRSYADMGFDLIFAPGNQYTDAVKEVAADYPNVYFALLNGTVETDNIVSLLPDAQQIGYMAGALAGLMSKTNSIGFIGGMELDTTKIKLESYEKAAKAVNSNIQVYSAYAGSFSDSAKGKEIADSMVTMNDVDVMFGDASAVDSGAREALSNYENRYDIGQPSDLLAIQESDVVIGSVVTDNAAMLEICMEDVKKGTYGNKTIYGDLSNGAISVGTFSDDVPEDIKEKYLEIVEQIKEGTFIEE
ncbi:BMP family protein [Defluviitalea phaphyphila]|uniref:BMP family protein n=1 Tax=Defluviitalea phaphyphila TaxID=1473580 RepID=UPI0007DC0BD8|nr:BMP family protein [Defluviitalea phaphyphila]